MKKIKSSFIGKAFFSLILLYLVVFLFLFVFQGLVFRTYYTSEKIRDIKSEVASLINKKSYSSLQIEELTFSKNTNTTTTIIPISNLKNNFHQLDLAIIEVEYDNGILQIYAPLLEDFDYSIGQKIISSASSKNNQIYIPTFLSVEENILIRQNNSDYRDPSLNNILGFEENQHIQIEGIISDIQYSNSPIVNSLVSNEILNMTSKNFISIVSYENGNYYYSNQTNTNDTSLVFYSTITIDNELHLLVSVYPMSYIDQIVNAAGRANVYMFIVVLLILILSAFVYSKEFSRPLLFINNKTKELSKLDFTSPRITIDSTDEFSELADNINTLSANLQATLYQLNEQNNQLSATIAKENIVEESRRDFIQGMSHELKTPLAVIQASAEALENNIYDTLEDKNEALKLIQNEVKKTKSMLNSMVTVYKLDSPNYKKQWLDEDIKALVINIAHSLSPLYINSNIEVVMNLDETSLKCEKDKIETIITNLFTNAIKYTPNDGRIEIKLQDASDSICFEITNFGVSIHKEHQKKIFDAFYRIDRARSRKDGSTGLGLYIVSQSLEQYNSKCFVKSTDNSVSFSFTIKKSF